MEEVYKCLNFPDTAYVNKKLEIDRFLNANGLNKDDVQIFVNTVDSVYIKYLLNTVNTNLKTRVNNGFSFSELLILEIMVNNKKSVYDVQKVVAKAIVYPTILIIKLKDKIKIGTYKNRDSKKNDTINVYSDVHFTGWFRLNDKNSRLNEILEKLNFDNFNTCKDFYELFNNYYKCLSEYSSKYIPFSDAIRFLKFEGLYNKDDFKIHVIKDFEFININPNDNTYISRFHTPRIEKYSNPKTSTLTMLCIDELYSFIKKYGARNIHSFDDFKDDLKNYYVHKNYYKTVEIEIRKREDCYYYSGYNSCNCSENYGFDCNDPQSCPYFERN